MNYSSRFWLYAPISLFLLLACAVMVHWWLDAGALEKKLAAWKGRSAVPGIVLDWDRVDVSGFPFRLDVDFSNLRIRGEAAHGAFFWQSEKFASHSLTYGRSEAVYEAAGSQELRWTDAQGGAHAVHFLPASIHASSLCDGDGLRRFDLDILDLGAKTFTIGRLQFHLRRDPDGADLDLMARADAAGSRPRIQIYATLNRAQTLVPLLRGQTAWPAAVANWRLGGGTVKLSRMVAPSLTARALLSALY